MSIKQRSFHFVARSRYAVTPFLDFNCSQWFWSELQVYFPDAHAAVLMPNHLHLLSPCFDPLESQERIRLLLRRTSLKFRLGKQAWEPMPSAVLVPDQKHLLRQIRYVHLNPCRSHFVKDPMSWVFSTHRDFLSLRLMSWPGVEKTAKELGFRSGVGRKRFHQYISADPSTSVAGTPYLNPLMRSPISHYSVADVLYAVQSAFLVRSVPVPRIACSSLLWLLNEQGHDHSALACRLTGLSRSQVYRVKKYERPDDEVRKILLHHLADPRLRMLLPPEG